jgi:hypothetical protein
MEWTRFSQVIASPLDPGRLSSWALNRLWLYACTSSLQAVDLCRHYSPVPATLSCLHHLLRLVAQTGSLWSRRALWQDYPNAAITTNGWPHNGLPKHCTATKLSV